jgi:hypothetical protein
VRTTLFAFYVVAALVADALHQPDGIGTELFEMTVFAVAPLTTAIAWSRGWVC